MRSGNALRGAAGLAMAGLLSAAAPVDQVAQVAGRYRVAFTNSMADGEAYNSVDELRIVRRGPHRAKVSVHLEFRNGHTCDFAEETRYEAGVFSVTTDPQITDGGKCDFQLMVRPDVLKISAKGEGCFAYCGMRGILDGAEFQRSLRRPLRPARPRPER